MQAAAGSGAVLFLLYVLFFFNNDHLPNRVRSSIGNPPPPTAANATLDFGAILYISMPFRTDRQDALSLMAAASGLKLTMIEGVDGDTISHKAEPDGLPEKMRGSRLGCWRAHANAWRYVIDNNLGSALILEDDVDWDMNIREVMGLWNWQLKYNNTIRWGQDVKKGWSEECPYGCDWDELFMGQCANKPNDERLDLHQTYYDPNGPKLEDNLDTFKKEITQVWNMTQPDQMRITSPTFKPLCLQGYSLSHRGAMRMLYHNGGYLGLAAPIDLEIAWRTAEGKLSGYTLTPPAISAWRVGGGKDSDNDPVTDKEEIKASGNSGGKSFGLKKSVRKNLEALLGKNYWEEMKKKN
ncbi:uncharacterized protein BDZ99DRAFT_380318 [Mytilinidion resinicola]|uniref:Glycosyl transferase family 25 domain-containing protein n=1 Tax=Mytilinidion resinicola TaxID=574789 RepID=A0A6A6YYU3_9PEZI|nr:uncharacterized protein BDZ99DRAFT_380318 [Mytilinidion resinicola]KAF2814092.1 hypothetical protein BDZ99DRAFT_380318 [Mytilinidion resinicola]